MARSVIRAVVLAAALGCWFADSAWASFETLGVMLDVSRGRVLKVEYLEKRFARLRQMGYNAVMLYTEDTFRLPDEPKWGYMRGGYTLEEVKRIKAAADRNGLRMIPCIETLGHLERVLRWDEYEHIRNTSSTVLVGEEATYALIDKILSFWQEAVGGERIHLGMDEACDFSGAAYAKKNGARQSEDVFLDHLVRVNALCKRHGFTDPIIWSDMLYRMASKSHEYHDPHAKADQALVSRVPANVRLCYWDYYHSDRAYYEGMIDGHRSFGTEPIVAGGIQLWHHFVNDREKTLGTISPLVAASMKKGVRELFVTLWGDGGGYAIPDAAEEGLFACAEIANGRTAEPTAENCVRFRCITGLDYRAMSRVGDINRHYADEWPDMIQEASILYDDPLFCGNYRNYLARKPEAATDRSLYRAVYKDIAWRDDGVKVIGDYQRTLDDCMGLHGLPPVIMALVRTLALKVKIEAGLLEAWKTKDRAALSRLVDSELPKAIAEMERFDELYRADWYDTSLPFGFERIQKRNAGALARLEEARRRLSDWLTGRAKTVEELDEAMRPFGMYNRKGVIEW